MTGELFNPEAFEQIPGQMAFEQERQAREAGEPVRCWRVSTIADGLVSHGHPIWTDACTPAGAAASVESWAAARCLDREIVAVELER